VQSTVVREAAYRGKIGADIDDSLRKEEGGLSVTVIYSIQDDKKITSPDSTVRTKNFLKSATNWSNF